MIQKELNEFLMQAARNNDLNKINYYLKLGANCFYDVIYIAILNNNYDLVKLMIVHGVNPNIVLSWAITKQKQNQNVYNFIKSYSKYNNTTTRIQK